MISYESININGVPCVLGTGTACFSYPSGDNVVHYSTICKEGTTVEDFAAQVEFPAVVEIYYNSAADCNNNVPDSLYFDYIDRCQIGYGYIYQCNFDDQTNAFVPSYLIYQGAAEGECTGNATATFFGCDTSSGAYCINVPIPQYTKVVTSFNNDQCTGDASTIETTIQTGYCNASTYPSGCSNATNTGYGSYSIVTCNNNTNVSSYDSVLSSLYPSSNYVIQGRYKSTCQEYTGSLYVNEAFCYSFLATPYRVSCSDGTIYFNYYNSSTCDPANFTSTQPFASTNDCVDFFLDSFLYSCLSASTPITSSSITTQGITTQSVTSGSATTSSITSSSVTSPSVTSSSLATTQSGASTARITTSRMTTASAQSNATTTARGASTNSNIGKASSLFCGVSAVAMIVVAQLFV